MQFLNAVHTCRSLMMQFNLLVMYISVNIYLPPSENFLGVQEYIGFWNFWLHLTYSIVGQNEDLVGETNWWIENAAFVWWDQKFQTPSSEISGRRKVYHKTGLVIGKKDICCHNRTIAWDGLVAKKVIWDRLSFKCFFKKGFRDRIIAKAFIVCTPSLRERSCLAWEL